MITLSQEKKECLKSWSPCMCCIITTLFGISLIGFLWCRFDESYGCPDPGYPYLSVEKCWEAPCTDSYYCLPDSRSNTSKISAVKDYYSCDNFVGWMWLFIASSILVTLALIIYKSLGYKFRETCC